MHICSVLFLYVYISLSINLNVCYVNAFKVVKDVTSSSAPAYWSAECGDRTYVGSYTLVMDWAECRDSTSPMLENWDTPSPSLTSWTWTPWSVSGTI